MSGNAANRTPPPGSGSAADAGAGASFWQRIMPRTVLGTAALLFFMSIAAAFSGAVLFAFYRFELDETQQRVADVESRTADEVDAADQVIQQRKDEALAEIDGLLDELEQFSAGGQTLDELTAGVRESVFLVSSLDENGQPSVGAAFVLFSDSERSYLVTSYTTVRAATVAPGPEITVRRGGEQIGVTLQRWDEARDLALLVAEDNPNLPAIEAADPSSVEVGDRLFAVSGLGSQGASIVQGSVSDVAANAVAHDVPVGVQYQGGPLLDAGGRLVAIASRAYSPVGFTPETLFFGVPVREACVDLVQCPADVTG